MYSSHKRITMFSLSLSSLLFFNDGVENWHRREFLWPVSLKMLLVWAGGFVMEQMKLLVKFMKLIRKKWAVRSSAAQMPDLGSGVLVLDDMYTSGWVLDTRGCWVGDPGSTVAGRWEQEEPHVHPTSESRNLSCSLGPPLGESYRRCHLFKSTCLAPGM
jgi:hypothetical protein